LKDCFATTTETPHETYDSSFWTPRGANVTSALPSRKTCGKRLPTLPVSEV
jgi:hypothetical protein